MATTKKKIKEVLNNETGLHGQYRSWFLEYASYVILERAVPAIEDGFKPVQRRIMHAMKEMDDGRYNKVANIIGQTMQYHPHGDASIGDALVNMGQKDLLIDAQGNWGDVRTGDEAAASRYIEARLSKFALDVVFNAKTTEWQLSYDGRKNEPVTLPVKFPLLLAQGADGIAVGLSTKILPHNFNELIDASVKYLKGKRFELLPDFLTGGMIDVTDYNQGKRGGKVKVRAHMEEVDKKTLLIKSVPYGVTTTQLMESIVKANDLGKIKIKKVTDNTAAEVEIQVDLAPGISPDITIDALYKFTDCEVSISPNACVIVDMKPQFLGVNELLKLSVDKSRDLLEQELKIRLSELQEKWHYTSLERIFFEEKIYKELEKKHETWEKVIEAIDKAFVPFKKQLKRAITREDILKLTEKPVRRIYKLDIDELNEQIRGLEAEIKQVKHDLNNIVDYAIA
ncbi:MAG TPA: DNA gyrase/topoisomerase IV subunit A, partial [Chitinophagaceae bacterium]|nr:DNA gyrase/topoisomerase IV subunit A [Chitinophagaceae bacterium]